MAKKKSSKRASGSAAFSKAGRRGSPVPSHLGIKPAARSASIESLNQILADLSALRALYKHFHWRVAGARFIMLHELYDKHAAEVGEQIDAVAERIQTLGGEATAWPGDIAGQTAIKRPADGLSGSPDEQLMALLEAHRVVLEGAHEAAERCGDDGDSGTDDLLSGVVIRAGQLQAWFIGEHLDHRKGE